MTLTNTPNSYGVISKFLHWSLLTLVLLQFYFIFWANYVLPEHSPLVGFYIGKLHKPFGMLTLVVAILAIVWRLFNVHPNFPHAMSLWERFVARLVHFLLYLCVILMPISGLIMSVAAGKPPNFFGLYQVPMFMEKNEVVAKYFFAMHGFLGISLIVLIVIHTLAALKHHFINRDHVLERMWF